MHVRMWKSGKQTHKSKCSLLAAAKTSGPITETSQHLPKSALDRECVGGGGEYEGLQVCCQTDWIRDTLAQLDGGEIKIYKHTQRHVAVSSNLIKNTVISSCQGKCQDIPASLRSVKNCTGTETS